MKRRYTIVHEPYVVEYLRRNYPPGTWMTNVRVGEPPEHLKALVPEERYQRMLKIWMGRLDALVILEDKVVLIEAFIRNQFGKVEQLLYYEFLFKRDTAFKEHWHKPIEKILLTPIECPFYFAFAKQFGIKVVVFRPDWLIPYLMQLRPREREGSRRGFPVPE